MRLIKSLLAALLVSTGAWALPSYPITLHDALAAQNPSDVIGNPALFDIDYLKISPLNASSMQVDIRFNYGGGTALNAFKTSNSGPLLNVGDLFFRTADSTYAYILHGHNGLAANGLYEIENTQSARTVLGNPDSTYRPNAQVWASANGAQLLGSGSSSITTVNNINTYLLAQLTIPLTNGLTNDLNGGFNIYFAAATCGNDEIYGHVPASGVPEPGTWALLGAGLIGIGFIRRNR